MKDADEIVEAIRDLQTTVRCVGYPALFWLVLIYLKLK